MRTSPFLSQKYITTSTLTPFQYVLHMINYWNLNMVFLLEYDADTPIVTMNKLFSLLV
jgi:hypothetical protein